MKYSFQNDLLMNMQEEYKKLLINGLEAISNGQYQNCIDQINIFWYSNRNIIKLILYTISPQLNCYAFTGASILGIDDDKHFPFATLGDIHMLDDPLSGFAEMVPNITNASFGDKLKEQIEHIIVEDISIITNYSDILILPMRSQFRENKLEFLKNSGDKAFLSLFKNKEMTVENYLSVFSSLTDVNDELSEEARGNIIFSNYDNLNEDIIARFKKYLSQYHMPYGDEINDVTSFYLVLHGKLSQALDILYTCFEYQIVPFIVHDATFKYLMYLGTYYIDNPFIQKMLFKSLVSHILYKNFNKLWNKEISFIDYCKKLKEYDFSNKVFMDIEKQEITLLNASYEQISIILQNNFKNLSLI